MVMASRDASIHWTGGLQDGSGQVTLESSNQGPFTVSWPARTESPDGKTSPEELIAAALCSCLAMNLSGVLGGEGLTAESIDISAEASLDKDPAGGARVSVVAVTLRATVPGVDAHKFAELAATAERTCPVSKALAGTTITLDAALDS